MSKLNKAFAKEDNKTATTNGMKAFKSTMDASVDYFNVVGASRGRDISNTYFAKSFSENKELALRIAMYGRDVRGGAGERQGFRDVLNYLSMKDKESCKVLLDKVSEIGRWDDLLTVTHPDLRKYAFDKIKDALEAGNGLCAKWMPRKGNVAVELRNYFGWTPKFYRKTLVNLSNTVETKMCDKEWGSVEYSHVPSLAFARYRKAFARNDNERFVEFIEKVNSGEAKINTGAVYPYDVLKNIWGCTYNTDKAAIEAQWNQLPMIESDAKVLPMIDVSGSMNCPAGGHNSKSKTTCMDVAVSLGLYIAEKVEGPLQNTVITFTDRPQLIGLKGGILNRVRDLFKRGTGYNTNIEAAFKALLDTAKKNKLKDTDMPDYIFMFSDMQFDCSSIKGTSLKMAKELYKKSGYKMPKLVYWNINASGNVQVKAQKDGTCLVSGFSPAIAKTILQADPDNFNPYQIMLDAVMIPRYDF